MNVLGLTGGIGMGKSACATLLRARSVPLVDTDELAREVVEPGQPALAEISDTFGPGVLDSSGCLRRDELARLVFADPIARSRLEKILHPRIRERWLAQVQQWRAEARSLSVVVIPLLFETGAEKELDCTLCVACSAASQRARLLARGWSEQEIQQRNAAQWPLEKKLLLADYVIWTEGSMDIHAAQLERVLATLTK